MLKAYKLVCPPVRRVTIEKFPFLSTLAFVEQLFCIPEELGTIVMYTCGAWSNCFWIPKELGAIDVYT